MPLGNVFDTLQVYLGSVYVNDFNRFGRTFQVRAQAEGGFRAEPDGHRAPEDAQRDGRHGAARLGARRRSGGAARTAIVRYNMFPAAEVNGDAAPGGSSGDAIATMERLAAQVLPPGMRIEWTDIAYQAEARRQHGALHLPALRAVRVPRALGRVRELVAAAGDHPDRADVPAVRARSASGCAAWTTT